MAHNYIKLILVYIYSSAELDYGDISLCNSTEVYCDDLSITGFRFMNKCIVLNDMSINYSTIIIEIFIHKDRYISLGRH